MAIEIHPENEQQPMTAADAAALNRYLLSNPLFKGDGVVERVAKYLGNQAAAGVPTGTEAKVCQMIASRQRLGVEKYGQTVANNPLALRAWLQHALEESLDQAIYLRRVIEELDAGTPMRVAALLPNEGELLLNETCRSSLGAMGLEKGDEVLVLLVPK